MIGEALSWDFVVQGNSSVHIMNSVMIKSGTKNYNLSQEAMVVQRS